MATFLQLQQRVSRRLLDPSNVAVALEDVKLAINEAIEYWKFRRFWFNTVRDTGTMTIQDSTIPLPSDFLVPFQDDGGFEIEYSNMRYPLAKLNQQAYDGIWLGNGYGLPLYYANLSGVYHTYPIPDRAYTVRRNYLKDYAELVNNSDSNDFTTYGSKLTEYWALADLHRDFRQDPKMSDAYYESAQDEYKNLQIMTAKSNATGGLTLHSHLGGY